MKKIVSIVGTRPQFLKLAPLIKQLKNFPEINHLIIHTGQHYDDEMSKNLFDTLEIPIPHYQLDIHGGTHSKLTAKMMIAIEKILLKEKPNMVLVYGDCDTTLAGALVTKKLEIKLMHIESGMRSFNKSMPEEINRILTDHISDILLCSTHDAIINLQKENIIDNVHYVGNLQLELLKMCASNNNRILLQHNLSENNYILLTIHRHYNTTADKIKIIFDSLAKLIRPIIFPVHPRTKKILLENNINIPINIKIIAPVNYIDMIVLEKNSYCIITDSGGIQSEAWYLGKKCLVMRSETEWYDAIKSNNNKLFNFEKDLVLALEELLEMPSIQFSGDASSSIKICKIVMES